MIQDIPDPDWMLDTGLAPAFEAMIDHGLVFDALVLPNTCPRCSSSPRVIRISRWCSITAPSRRSRSGDLDRVESKESRALARETPMVCKLSGLVTEAGSAVPQCCAGGRSPARMLRTAAPHVGQRLAGVRARVLV